MCILTKDKEKIDTKIKELKTQFQANYSCTHYRSIEKGAFFTLLEKVPGGFIKFFFIDSPGNIIELDTFDFANMPQTLKGSN